MPLSTLAATAASPSTAATKTATANQNAALSQRLAWMIQDLDQDQSRRLSRIGGGDWNGAFKPATLGQIAELLDGQAGQAVVVFAGPRRAGQKQLDVDSSLLLASKTSARGVISDSRARNAYVYNGPLDASWNSLLAGLDSTPAKSTGARTVSKNEGIEAIAKSRAPTFLFLMATDPVSKASSVQKLILIPDTVMISFNGKDAAPSTSTNMQSPAPQGAEPEPPAMPRDPVISQAGPPMDRLPSPMDSRMGPAPPTRPDPSKMPEPEVPPMVEPPSDEDQ